MVDGNHSSLTRHLSREGKCPVPAAAQGLKAAAAQLHGRLLLMSQLPTTRQPKVASFTPHKSQFSLTWFPVLGISQQQQQLYPQVTMQHLAPDVHSDRAQAVRNL